MYIKTINESLILCFDSSYNDPTFVLYNLNNHCVQNYIDVNNIKEIVYDKVYDNMKEQFHISRNLNRMYKGIDEVDGFVNYYKNVLKHYKNEAEISGYDCIDIEFE